VVWKWKLHTGSEVEAMRTRWYGSGGEEGIAERVGRRRVYCDGFGNSDNLRQRLVRTEAERNGRGLEASPFADGNRISARPRAPAGI